LKSSALPIDGSATLTIEASRTTTNCVKASRARARFFVRAVTVGATARMLPVGS